MLAGQRWHSRWLGGCTVAGMWEALQESVQAYVDDPTHPELTWTMRDKFEDYDEYTEFFNHFENHREAMTTKIGLQRTLREQRSSPSFFPESFDMNEPQGREAFIVEFRRYAALGVARRHLRLSGTGGYAYSTEMLKIASLTLEDWIAELVLAPRRPLTQFLGISASEWQSFLKYSTLETAQLNLESAEPYHWRAGEVKPLASFEKLVRDVEARWPQASLDDGQNVWIVKPHAESKATGLKCMQRLPDIMRHCMASPYSTVQKYIERPFLLDGRKFHIRQWVLLKSAAPLKAFMFSECYFRLCDQQYNLATLDDVQSHLSNYQVNQEGDSMSVPEFKERLAQVTGRDDLWEEEIRPQLDAIVLATCKAARSKLVQRSGCFELYGFDLMLDADLRVWLLEVNSSPDCRHSAPFLDRMLPRMTRRLLQVACLDQEEPDGEQYDWELLASESTSPLKSY